MFQNYLALEVDKPTRIHIDDYHYIQRIIHDPVLGKDKPVWSHMFWLDRVDGEPAARTFSVLSEGLWQQLEPYVKRGTFREYEFVITKRGEGHQTKYEVEVFPSSGKPNKDMIGS